MSFSEHQIRYLLHISLTGTDSSIVLFIFNRARLPRSQHQCDNVERFIYSVEKSKFGITDRLEAKLLRTLDFSK